jgi:hypothetical protein
VGALMVWKKIDDEQTNVYGSIIYNTYSAFLANGLTSNANNYNAQLTRGGAIAWNAKEQVTWASYHRPQGVMFTVNVGQQVTDIDFRVRYATITASADADGFQGKAFITHLGTGEFVEVGVLPTTGVESYFDVSMPLITPVSGPQSFSFTFRSSKLDSLGYVDVQGGEENIIYLDQIGGGGGAYNITQGEKFALLSLAEPGYIIPAIGPSTQADQYYQINYINTNAHHPPDAYASVFPSLTTDPPRLSAIYDNNKQTAVVFELGAITLFSIAYNVTDANEGYAPAQYAHNSATALPQVINIQNTALRQFQPDLCNGLSQRFSLGAVIAGSTTIPIALAAQKLSFTFCCGDANVESELAVTFSAYTLYQTSRQEIRLNLYNQAGTLLTTFKQSIYAPTDRNQQCVVGTNARGWYDTAAVQAWGMRDSMPDTEMLNGSPQVFIIPSRTYNQLEAYTVELESVFNVTAFYVYNVYARFIVSGG